VKLSFGEIQCSHSALQSTEASAVVLVILEAKKLGREMIQYSSNYGHCGSSESITYGYCKRSLLKGSQ